MHRLLRVLLRRQPPPTDMLFRDKIEHLFATRWPDPAHRPLPRGAIARIAKEVGCSRAYAHRIARQLGYHQEHTP